MHDYEPQMICVDFTRYRTQPLFRCVDEDLKIILLTCIKSYMDDNSLSMPLTLTKSKPK